MYKDRFSQIVVPIGTGVLGAETISAAAAVHGGYLATRVVHVKRIMFIVTTLVAADTTLAVLEFNRRPTPGSAAGEVAMGTLTIPDATAVGQVIYKDIDPVKLLPGESLSLEQTTQAVDGGGAAGAGYYAFELEVVNEYDANMSKTVASA